MSLWRTARRCPHAGFPRVSGDEPQKVTTQEMNQLFSPRERG